MAEHVIRVNPLSPTSIIRAYNKYLKIRQQFDQNVNIFLMRVAECGRDMMDMLGYTPDSGEIRVTVEQIDNGYCINVEGIGAIILEFGAGDATVATEYASKMPFPVAPGSYSESHDGMYHKYGFWIFGGIKYTEITPRYGMSIMWTEIMLRWRRIAEEVFV